MGLLVGGFESDNIKRKYPKVYKAIFKDTSFDDNTLENMLSFLNSKGMKEEEQKNLETGLMNGKQLMKKTKIQNIGLYLDL